MSDFDVFVERARTAARKFGQRIGRGECFGARDHLAAYQMLIRRASETNQREFEIDLADDLPWNDKFRGQRTAQLRRLRNAVPKMQARVKRCRVR